MWIVISRTIAAVVVGAVFAGLICSCDDRKTWFEAIQIDKDRFLVKLSNDSDKIGPILEQTGNDLCGEQGFHLKNFSKITGTERRTGCGEGSGTYEAFEAILECESLEKQ